MQTLLTDEQLRSYDHFIVAFSGGKDSIACFLHLLELGVERSKIELWHHDVDGREEGQGFMDWPSTPGYVRAFADWFNVPVYFSWREGGFLREMLRNLTPTAQTIWENPDGTLGHIGGKGKPNTRLQFPQVSADLSTRWCSAYLKIDVMKRAIANQPRFNDKKTLVISGERAEESAARAKYATFEPHATSTPGRQVDQWRPVHAWTETQVWAIMKRHGINPHPAYRLSWGRLSCALCIFGGANQWASAKRIFPERVARVAAFEVAFGKTIDRTLGVEAKAARGTAYAQTGDAQLVAEAKDANWNGPIFVGNDWQLPAGAFSGDTCGPR
jgi:3'-phosphoadenosine 5'-phosphosulfate sulfotransferase (PAPS reductase)/FAD synthetase